MGSARRPRNVPSLCRIDWGSNPTTHMCVATIQVTVVSQEGRATHEVEGGRGGGAKGSTRPGRKVARKIFRAFRWLDSARRCGLSGLETTVEGTGEGERERSETNTILESETGSETRFVLT